MMVNASTVKIIHILKMKQKFPIIVCSFYSQIVFSIQTKYFFVKVFYSKVFIVFLDIFRVGLLWFEIIEVERQQRPFYVGNKDFVFS